MVLINLLIPLSGRNSVTHFIRGVKMRIHEVDEFTGYNNDVNPSHLKVFRCQDYHHITCRSGGAYV